MDDKESWKTQRKSWEMLINTAPKRVIRAMGNRGRGWGKERLVHNSFSLIMASLAQRAAGIAQAAQGNLIPGNPKKAVRDAALSPGKPHYTILQCI